MAMRRRVHPWGAHTAMAVAAATIALAPPVAGALDALAPPDSAVADVA